MLYTPVDVSDTDTYNEQQAECVAKGMKLCTLDELCPTQGGFGFDTTDYLDSPNYVAYQFYVAYDGTDSCGCTGNAWVRIDLTINACKTHCEFTDEYLSSASCPVWGTVDGVGYTPPAYACCAL